VLFLIVVLFVAIGNRVTSSLECLWKCQEHLANDSMFSSMYKAIKPPLSLHLAPNLNSLLNYQDAASDRVRLNVRV